MSESSKGTPHTAEPFVADDTTLRGFVGYHMKRAFNVVQADLSVTLKPFGLRMLTYTALILIVDNPGLSQSQLAGAMDVERPNLVVIVDELEQRGLIVRERVPRDRRAYALRATPQGQALYNQTIEAVKTHEAVLLQGLDAQTKDSVIAALRLIQSRRTKGQS